MMYSEFIEISGYTEKYISFAEYATYIEPVYMECEQIPTKQEFIKQLKSALECLVTPAVKIAMKNFSLEEKLAFLNEEDHGYLTECLNKVEFEARKLAYQYLKFMLSLCH